MVAIDCGDWSTQPLDACRQTFEAMTRGEPIIHQGVVWNPSNETYGAPDLLVRSDVLRSLFPEALSEADAAEPAPGLGAGPWHYRVVDIKFTSLQLDKHWNAGTGHLPYMAQTFIYNEALGRIQGYLPPASYLLGRSWKGPKDSGGTNCLDRLAPVPHDLMLKDRSLRDVAEEAVAWTRRLRFEGAEWDPKDAAAHPILRPNLGEASHPWTSATRQIAEDIADPTLAWQVGHGGREKARDAGVLRWTDPAFNASVVELGAKNGPILDQMLAINRDPAAKAVNPARIQSHRETWGEPGTVEFYVDFETVTDVDDDFSRLPERGGQGQIFMIGCGHVENGAWKFACFVAEELTLNCEAEIIERWLAHMEGCPPTAGSWLRAAPRLSLVARRVELVDERIQVGPLPSPGAVWELGGTQLVRLPGEGDAGGAGHYSRAHGFRPEEGCACAQGSWPHHHRLGGQRRGRTWRDGGRMAVL